MDLEQEAQDQESDDKDDDDEASVYRSLSARDQ
jgi:hypothetical protein